MKQIDGKARRVLRYERWFYWYAGIGGLAAIGLAVLGTPHAWPQIILGVFGGICLGWVACLRFRDTP